MGFHLPAPSAEYMRRGVPFILKFHSECVTLDDNGRNMHKRELHLGHINSVAVDIDDGQMELFLIIEPLIARCLRKRTIAPAPTAGSWAVISPRSSTVCLAGGAPAPSEWRPSVGWGTRRKSDDDPAGVFGAQRILGRVLHERGPSGGRKYGEPRVCPCWGRRSSAPTSLSDAILALRHCRPQLRPEPKLSIRHYGGARSGFASHHLQEK